MIPEALLSRAHHAGGASLREECDERLIRLTRNGNERAFEAIVERYRRPLVAYCARLVGGGRAEDAVQQAFLKAYDAIRRDEVEINLRPWLYRIAHNTALNLRRERGWNEDEIDSAMAASSSSTPPELFERREGVRQLVSAIQQLPQRQRDAIVLREFEGRSYEEMASRLSISDGAVAQLLNRARLHLRSAVASIMSPFLTLRFAVMRRGARGRMEPVTAASGGAGALGTAVKVSAVLLAGGGIAATGAHVAFDAPSGHAAHRSATERPVPGAQRDSAGDGGMLFGRSGPWSLGARGGRSDGSSPDMRRGGAREDSGSVRGLSGSPKQGGGDGSGDGSRGGSTPTPGGADGRGFGSDPSSGSRGDNGRGDNGGGGQSGRDSSGGSSSEGSGGGGGSSEGSGGEGGSSASQQLSAGDGGGGGSSVSGGGSGGSSGASSSSGDGSSSGSGSDGGGGHDGGGGSGPR